MGRDLNTAPHSHMVWIFSGRGVSDFSLTFEINTTSGSELSNEIDEVRIEVIN